MPTIFSEFVSQFACCDQTGLKQIQYVCQQTKNDEYETEVNPSLIDKNLDWSKLKAFADDKIKVKEK